MVFWCSILEHQVGWNNKVLNLWWYCYPRQILDWYEKRLCRLNSHYYSPENSPLWVFVMWRGICKNFLYPKSLLNPGCSDGYRSSETRFNIWCGLRNCYIMLLTGRVIILPKIFQFSYLVTGILSNNLENHSNF